MKLKSLNIQNFRGIKGSQNEIKFDKSDILFVCGQNNVGKSTILKAYEFFYNAKQKAIKEDFYNKTTDKPIVMEAVFIKEPEDDERFKDQNLNDWVSSDGEVKVRKIWREVDSLFKKNTFKPATNKYSDDAGFGGMDTILQSNIPEPILIKAMPTTADLELFVKNTIKKDILTNLNKEEQDEYQKANEAIKRLNNLLNNTKKIESMNQEANKAFKKIFPNLNLQISSSTNETLKLDDIIYKDFDVHTQSLECGEDSKSTLDSQGSGVIRQAMFNLLGIVKHVIKDKPKKYIILFEEPELYLHPKKIRLLRDSLYKLCQDTHFQSICVTHNPQLIDLEKEHTTILRMSKNEEIFETEIHQVDDFIFRDNDLHKDRLLMLNRFNPHICETFFADEVILVEGDTEAVVLRSLLQSFYPEKDIFVLNTGSKTNIPFFMNILTHFKIKHHAIHDIDEQFQQENGTVKLNKDGTERKNPAWLLNQKISDERDNARAKFKDTDFSNRYMLMTNFETAHNYKVESKKGKPLSAYEYVRDHISDKSSDVPILNILKMIMGKQPISKEHIHTEQTEII